MQAHLHIISFDIPYPANYGGAIDVFHKIRCLNAQGVKIILHCFEYGGRKSSPELEKICEKVYFTRILQISRDVCIFKTLISTA